jgi:uncharacterized protein (TIGR02452 family)
MIKRNGIELMNSRTNNVSIAKETLEIIKNKQYISPSDNIVDISQSLDASIKNTYLHKKMMSVKEYSPVIPTIEVTNETTTNAALRLIDASHTNVVALNFASAVNVGGGFLGGSIAQEEDLCRCSGLYACLKSKPVFYNDNILYDSAYYTDNVIYSPNVPFFRNDNHVLMEKPFELSIITAPAPCLRNMENIDQDMLHVTLRCRIRKILQIAEDYKHKTLVLGAWGCGAFKNDPEIVANVFSEMLKEIPAFEHICFAVYDNDIPAMKFNTFNNIFKNIFQG